MRRSLIFLLGLLLAACSTAESTTPSPTAVAMVATSESTSTATMAPTQVAALAATATPTEHPTPRPTASATPVASPTIVPTLTPTEASDHAFQPEAFSRFETYPAVPFSIMVASWLPEPQVEAVSSTLSKVSWQLNAAPYVLAVWVAESEAVLRDCCLPAGTIQLNDEGPYAYAFEQSISSRTLIVEGEPAGLIFTDDNQAPILHYRELFFLVTVLPTTEEEVDIRTPVKKLASELVATIWYPHRYAATSFSEEWPVEDELWSTASSISPDGQYQLDTFSFNPYLVTDEPDLSYPMERHRQLLLLRHADETVVLVDEIEGWGLGVGMYRPVRWTDEALFFTYAPMPDGCGGDVNMSDLWRYQFETGEVVQLLPTLTYIASLSPDGTQLIGNHNRGFQLVDLGSATIQYFSFPQNAEGQLVYVVWHPHQAEMLLVTAVESCGYPTRAHQLWLANVAQSLLTPLTTFDSAPLSLVEWGEDGLTLSAGEESIFVPLNE